MSGELDTPRQPRAALGLFPVVLVTALFIGSGFVSGYMMQRPQHLLTMPTVGLPFGIAASALLIRPLYLAPVVAALHGLVWSAAYVVAVYVTAAFRLPVLAVCAAGLLGGIGVAAAVGIGHRHILRWRPLLFTGVVGALAGIPFSLVATEHQWSLTPWFSIWHAAVGLCLWVQCRRGA